MSRGRWIKYERTNSKVLEIIRKSERHVTTNEIRLKLDQEYNLKISWITLNKYLEDLAWGGHITGIQIKKKHIIRMWQTKEANNGIATKAEA